MKHLKHQEGMVLPVTIGLVLIVILVTAVAVWQSQQAYTKHVTSSPASTATATPVKPLVIRELGIQIEPSGDINDLIYATSNANGRTTVSFSSSSLVAADRQAGGSYCAADGDAPLGRIGFDTTPSASERVIKDLGGKKLTYMHAQSACSSNAEVMTLANKQIQALLDALGKAELAR